MDYSRNEDMLCDESLEKNKQGAYNAVLGVRFSNEQAVTLSSYLKSFKMMGNGTATYSLTGYSAIKLLFVDGINFVETTGAPAEKEFTFDGTTLTLSISQPTDVAISGLAATSLSVPIVSNEPVTTAEAAYHCRIDIVENETYLQSLITAARQQCEQYVNLSLIDRTVTARLRNDLGGKWLPFSPVKSVITPGIDVQFDKLETKSSDITIEYEAGYGGNLPAALKTAILSQVAWLYQHRGDEMEGDILSPVAKSILKPLRRL